MATTPSATAAAASQSAPSASTPATPAGEVATKTVNISLPQHIHEWFARRAASEDRTINNFISRALKAVHADAHKDVDED